MSCTFVSVILPTVNNETGKGSQVVWEDPKEVEERMKLLESLKATDQNLTPMEENDTSGLEADTTCSIDMDMIAAIMMVGDGQNLG